MTAPAHRWLDMWHTESKLIDQAGQELGRVQADGPNWRSFAGLDHPIVTGSQSKDAAKRLVEASV